MDKFENKTSHIRDLAIIGMGASGSMAAIKAADYANVDLFDGNEKLGKKIYITGKGRCNVTNAVKMPQFMQGIARNPKFMYSAFKHFSNEDLMNFFESNACPLKVERGFRVFPKSDRSSDINKTLEKVLIKKKVNLYKNCKIAEVSVKDGVFCLETDDYNKDLHSKKLYYKSLIIATGGLSYPSTGSTGDGLIWAEKMGHKIIKMTPSLVGFKLRDSDLKALTGLSLKNISLQIKSGKKTWTEFGDLIFTENGISGPSVLTMSANISGMDPEKLQGIKMELDWKPALSHKQLEERMSRERSQAPNRILKSLLASFLPKSAIDVFLTRAGLDPQKPFNQMTKAEEDRFINLLKHFKLTFDGDEGFKQAVISRGGVSTKEINPSSMESKICKNLYFCGEIIDVDGFTGGYNLQIAFSTGYLAGYSAGIKIKEERGYYDDQSYSH